MLSDGYQSSVCPFCSIIDVTTYKEWKITFHHPLPFTFSTLSFLCFFLMERCCQVTASQPTRANRQILTEEKHKSILGDKLCSPRLLSHSYTGECQSFGRKTGFLHYQTCYTYFSLVEIIGSTLIVLDEDEHETKMLPCLMRRVVPLPPLPDGYGGYRSLLDTFLASENKFFFPRETRTLVFPPLLRDLLKIEYNSFCRRVLKKLSAKSIRVRNGADVPSKI